MSVTVIATVFPTPEHRADVIAAYEVAIPRVHAEDDGCELYAMQVGEDRLVIVEKWASPEALRAHAVGDAVTELHQAYAGKLGRDSDIQVLTPHPAGTAEQGAL